MARSMKSAHRSPYDQIVCRGVRQAAAAYIDPSAGILTFDKDHAIASFPLAALRFAGTAAQAHGGASFDDDERKFIARKCRERKQALSALLTLIQGTLKT
jgi:hypothetical protein